MRGGGYPLLVLASLLWIDSFSPSRTDNLLSDPAAPWHLSYDCDIDLPHFHERRTRRLRFWSTQSRRAW